MSSIPPFLLKTADNPDGVDKAIFEGIQKAIVADRLKFLSAFLADFYNADVLGGKLVSDQVMQYSWNVAAAAGAKATLDCVAAWLTDFRSDVSRINVPTLIIHGDADRILPIASTAIPLSKSIKGSRLVVVKGGPHGIIWTHAEEVNSALLEFLEAEDSSAEERRLITADFPNKKRAEFSALFFCGMTRPNLTEATLNSGIRPGFFGGADRDRTDGLIRARDALSQLSYCPKIELPKLTKKLWCVKEKWVRILFCYTHSENSEALMARELAKVYEPADVEDRWYKFWVDKRYFHADPANDGRPYSMVIPPPNVTGVLHMGHALNNTLQDALARWKRMSGSNTLWMPGTDHAGIATQNVVERQLAAEGTTRHAYGREEFIARVWKWREQSGGTIINQLKRLGASCDWERERFTMDEGLSRAVREVFVRLYEEGLIYRGDYIINWCPRCMTALSDLEVDFEAKAGKLYFIDYPLEDGSGKITVATTRPETMLGDTAVAVNPDDERYRDFIR